MKSVRAFLFPRYLSVHSCIGSTINHIGLAALHRADIPNKGYVIEIVESAFRRAGYISRAIILVSFLFAELALAQATGPARVVVEHWPPWEIAYDENKENVTGGLAIEILQEMFNRLNIAMQLNTVTWSRALKQIKDGDQDLIPMITENDERGEFMVFTVPVYTDPMLFAYSTDRFNTFDWEEWNDLQSLEIGITRGYNYGDLDNALVEFDLKTQVVSKDILNMRKLLRGRIDITPLYYMNAIGMLEGMSGSHKIKFTRKPANLQVFKFGISRKSFLVDRLDDINNTIQEMQSDGAFRKILKEFYIEYR